MYRMTAVIATVGVVIVLACAASVTGQSPPTFEGMWSDPPLTAEDNFCSWWCTDAGLQRLTALLNDPANDARPFAQLVAEATARQTDQYIRPRLSAAALKTFPLDVATDPGFLRCEPWGFARQVTSRHQLQIRRAGPDRLEMRYGEWDARRVVYLDGRPRPAGQAPTLMGHSVGRYEGGALVIETSGVAPSWTPFRSEHSDQLRTIERYTRSADGQRLLLSLSMTDPWGFREPVVLKKVWRWAPGAEIAPYKDCQRPNGSATAK
jgi:hypothetical protein